MKVTVKRAVAEQRSNHSSMNRYEVQPVQGFEIESIAR